MSISTDTPTPATWVEKWKALYCDAAANQNMGCRFLVGQQQWPVFGFWPCLQQQSSLLEGLKHEDAWSTEGMVLLTSDSHIAEYEFLMVWNALHGGYRSEHFHHPDPYELKHTYELTEECRQMGIQYDPKLHDNRQYLLSLVVAQLDPVERAEINAGVHSQRERLWHYMNALAVPFTSPLWIDYLAWHPRNDEPGLMQTAWRNQLLLADTAVRHRLLQVATEQGGALSVHESTTAYELLDNAHLGINAVLSARADTFCTTLRLRHLAHDETFVATAFHFKLPGYIRDWVNAHVRNYEFTSMVADGQLHIVHSFCVDDGPYLYLRITHASGAPAWGTGFQGNANIIGRCLRLLNTSLEQLQSSSPPSPWASLFTWRDELVDTPVKETWDRFQAQLHDCSTSMQFAVLLCLSVVWEHRVPRSRQVRVRLCSAHDGGEQTQYVVYQDVASLTYFLVVPRKVQLLGTWRYLLSESGHYTGRMDDWGEVHTVPDNDPSGVPASAAIWEAVQAHIAQQPPSTNSTVASQS